MKHSKLLRRVAFWVVVETFFFEAWLANLPQFDREATIGAWQVTHTPLLGFFYVLAIVRVSGISKKAKP